MMKAGGMRPSPAMYNVLINAYAQRVCGFLLYIFGGFISNFALLRFDFKMFGGFISILHHLAF